MTGGALVSGRSMVLLPHTKDEPMTVKLNDLQRMLLSDASQNDDRQLEVSARNSIDAAKTMTAIASLVRRKLVEKGDASDAADAPTYRITDAGLTVIGAIEAPVAVAEKVSSAPQTKTALVLSLLNRTEGATLDQMVAATGWLPHTTRAALTGLRKRGHAVARTVTDDGSVYRIEAAA